MTTWSAGTDLEIRETIYKTQKLLFSSHIEGDLIL